MSTKATGQFMGVCATISNKTGIDVFAIRVITVILFFATTGVVVPMYVVLGLFASEV